jgi:ribosomal protein S18 acetylase RimI-like enzyme
VCQNRPHIPPEITLRPAAAGDARELAELHMTARSTAMPYLRQLHSNDETRAWFERRIASAESQVWVAARPSSIVGYMVLHGEDLDDLYVLPTCQRQGIGARLLDHAKALSPRRLQLYTFQRNTGAQAFYEAHGFHAVRRRDGSHNEENEPDVEYERRGSRERLHARP